MASLRSHEILLNVCWAVILTNDIITADHSMGRPIVVQLVIHDDRSQDDQRLTSYGSLGVLKCL